MKQNKANILVIDDDLGIVQALQEILEAEGYTVVTAVNGESGLKQLQEQAFDLTLTDLSMPGLGRN